MLGGWDEWMVVSLIYYIKQFQFNQFIIIMKRSPNKQALHMDVKTSIAFLLHQDTSQLEHTNRKAHLRILQVPKEQLKKEIQILSWRYKTYLPIVKPLEYTLQSQTPSPPKHPHLPASSLPPSKSHISFRVEATGNAARESVTSCNQNNICELAVRMEETKCRLSDIDLLPFSQIIYLLKEMLIGYDALLDIFGNFGPTEQMVAVSTSNQWKVWVNQDFFRNQKYEGNPTGGERQFIYRLFLIAEKHCQGSSISKIFFHEMKQYTYSNECGFIKMLEKIKEFTKNNKIFQVNKVILPNETRQEKPFNPESPNFKASLNASDNFGQTQSRHKPGQFKLRLEKKASFQPQPVSAVYSPTYQGMKRSNFNHVPGSYNNVSQIVRQPGTTSQLYHVQSQKVINKSSLFYYPQQNSFTGPQNCIPTLQSNKSSSFLQKPTETQKKARQSYFQGNEQKKMTNVFKSPQLFQKPRSPQPQRLERNSTSYANISKSRHELKLLVSRQQSKNPSPEIKTRKNQRKYSEQIFKPRSVDALAAGIKKICGSNIYEQDPEIKMNGINVIKTRAPVNANNSPSKPLKADPSSNKTQEKTSTLKGPGSSTPNHSSSTNEMHRSDENNQNHKGTSYQYLKQNDLNYSKSRNNQSSYYGMGGYPQEQKRENKNMTISYEFKNRQQNHSKSSSSSKKKNQENGNNWAKKISGLFSDDASIKHLKGSVKFKTAEEQRFEKEYLKDVKLQMLQKFGRPVRHSIVDEDDDFRPNNRNPHNSMQLIEEALDEGKSYMQKDESQIDQEEVVQVRGRTRTVQVIPARQESPREPYRQIKQRECVSYQCSENSDSEPEQFNFESQGYVLNRR